MKNDLILSYYFYFEYLIFIGFSLVENCDLLVVRNYCMIKESV